VGIEIFPTFVYKQQYMLNSTIKTEIRPTSGGYQVWYSLDGGQSVLFHKKFKSMDNAVKETVILRGHYKLLGDLKMEKQ
jgi:hypothetical protein